MTGVPVRILLPVDLNREADLLVSKASPWAERLEATIDLLFVDELAIPLPHVRDPKVQSVLEAQWERLRIEQEAALTALRSRMPEAIRGAVLRRTGAPAKAVLEEAASYELVLVGTHGRTGLAHLWLGSVAEQIVRRSPVEVLVIRLPQG